MKCHGDPQVDTNVSKKIVSIFRNIKNINSAINKLTNHMMQGLPLQVRIGSYSFSHYRVDMRSPLELLQHQLTPVHTLTQYFPMIYSVITTNICLGIPGGLILLCSLHSMLYAFLI